MVWSTSDNIVVITFLLSGCGDHTSSSSEVSTPYSLQLCSDVHITQIAGDPTLGLDQQKPEYHNRDKKGPPGTRLKTHPDLKAVMIQSAQKRCRHSLVVIVFFNMSRQIGHISSLCKDLGDTAISSPSVIASCAIMKQIKMEVSTHNDTQLLQYSSQVRLKSHPTANEESSFWLLQTSVFYFQEHGGAPHLPDRLTRIIIPSADINFYVL